MPSILHPSCDASSKWLLRHHQPVAQRCEPLALLGCFTGTGTGLFRLPLYIHPESGHLFSKLKHASFPITTAARTSFTQPAGRNVVEAPGAWPCGPTVTLHDAGTRRAPPHRFVRRSVKTTTWSLAPRKGYFPSRIGVGLGASCCCSLLQDKAPSRRMGLLGAVLRHQAGEPTLLATG